LLKAYSMPLIIELKNQNYFSKNIYNGTTLK
jgi:hypothetical protein